MSVFIPDQQTYDRIVAAVRRVESMPLDPAPIKREYHPGGGGERTPYLLVCEGPDSEPPATNNKYWAQALGLSDDDPPEPIGTGTIREIVNLGEALTGTHYLRVGEVVDAWEQTDVSGVTWLVCDKVP